MSEIKTKPVTVEYEEGHARTFGQPDASFPRGRRFRWDPERKALVPAGFVAEKRALDAGVLSGRFYENTKALDGADIGSRRRHREYMRANGLAPADDFKQVWAKREEQRAKIFTEAKLPDKTRRDDIGRALHRLHPE